MGSIVSESVSNAVQGPWHSVWLCWFRRMIVPKEIGSNTGKFC